MMSKPKYHALVFAAVTACLASTSQAQNLIANGDIEGTTTSASSCGTLTGTFPSSWNDNTCANAASANFSVVTGTAYSGTKSLKVDTLSGRALFYAPFWLNTGNKYTATVYIKGAAAQEVIVKFRDLAAPYAVYGLASKTVTSSGWTQVTIEGAAPLDRNTVGGLFIETKSPGTIYVDNASVTGAASPMTDVVRATYTVPKTFFGIHSHRDRSVSPLIGATGVVGARRIWNIDGAQLRHIFPTAASQTNDALRNWTAFDNAIADAQANGVELIMTLGGNTPAWAALSGYTNPPAGCNDWGTATSGPVDALAWDDMINAVINRAAGRIKYWEPWNEPYNCQAFKQRRPTDNLGTLKFYASDLHASIQAYNTAHGTQLKVLTPSFSTEYLDFLDEYLALSGTLKADIISVHAYDPYIQGWLNASTPGTGRADAPEAYFVKEHSLHAFQTILDRYSKSTGLPIWNTESGYLNAADASNAYNDAKGAPYVARHLLLSLFARNDASYYYAWDQDPHTNPSTGATEHAVSLGRSATTPSANMCASPTDPCFITAAGTAYQQTATWLTGATTQELCTEQICSGAGTASGNKVWRARIQRVVGGVTQTHHIVWNPTGETVNYTVPAGVTKSTSLSGTVTTISGGVVVVTGSPQLLTP